MSLSYDSIVQRCADEPASMPKIRYSFVPIADIASKPTNAVVDVIGVVSDVSAVTKCARPPPRRAARDAQPTRRPADAPRRLRRAGSSPRRGASSPSGRPSWPTTAA